MSKDLYFESKSDEICYPLDYFQEQLKEGESRLLYEAIPDKVDGVAWCKELFSVVERGCSSGCKFYSPRNKKNGCCSNYTTQLYGHGDPVLLTIKDEKPILTTK